MFFQFIIEPTGTTYISEQLSHQADAAFLSSSLLSGVSFF